jgi:hypothetical protein
MKTGTLSWLRVIGAMLKYLASAIMVLVALGALGLAFVVRLGGLAGMTLLTLLGAWGLGMVWFLHFRQRTSTAIRRGVAVALIAYPICFCFAWANFWRLETYLSHRHWLTYRSEHFVFHYAPNYSRANEMAAFASARDRAFDQNCAYLKVAQWGKTDFYVYDELEEGFAVPDWNVIFADDDQSIGHEMTHIIAYHIAGRRQKIRLLDEGIATWLNHSTRVTNHHFVAWDYIRTNGLPPLGELAHTRAFRRHQPPAYYPAASFVGYLIENQGVDAFRRLWTASARYPDLYSSAEELRLARHFPFIPGERVHFESAVLKVYGRTLSELDTEWRAWLESRCTDPEA